MLRMMAFIFILLVFLGCSHGVTNNNGIIDIGLLQHYSGSRLAPEEEATLIFNIFMGDINIDGIGIGEMKRLDKTYEWWKCKRSRSVGGCEGKIKIARGKHTVIVKTEVQSRHVVIATCTGNEFEGGKEYHIEWVGVDFWGVHDNVGCIIK